MKPSKPITIVAVLACLALVGCGVSKAYVAAEARGANEAASASLMTVKDLTNQVLQKCIDETVAAQGSGGTAPTCEQIKRVMGIVEGKLEDTVGHARALCKQAGSPCETGAAGGDQ